MLARFTGRNKDRKIKDDGQRLIWQASIFNGRSTSRPLNINWVM
jgi:hypothetical protein